MRAVVPDSHTKANGPFFSLSLSLSLLSPFPESERDTHKEKKRRRGTSPFYYSQSPDAALFHIGSCRKVVVCLGFHAPENVHTITFLMEKHPGYTSAIFDKKLHFNILRPGVKDSNLLIKRAWKIE